MIELVGQFRVLFVCSGNVCRSPFAERLLRLRLAERLGDRTDRFQVSSAGTTGVNAAGMDPHTAAELARRGGDPRGFVSRRLREADLAAADLVLTAERAQRSVVLGLAPQLLGRAFTIREFADLADVVSPSDSLPETVQEMARRRSETRLDEYDIDDPYRRSPAHHAAAAVNLDLAVTRIADLLAVFARD